MINIQGKAEQGLVFKTSKLAPLKKNLFLPDDVLKRKTDRMNYSDSTIGLGVIKEMKRIRLQRQLVITEKGQVSSK